MEIFVISALIGLVIGLCSGLLGIGGGTLMVPVFRLGFGMSAIASTATSLFTIIPTSLMGCATHIKNKTCIPKLGIATGLAGACTSPVGVVLASMSPSWLIMLAAACIIGYSSFTMFKKAVRMPKETPSSLAKASAGTVRAAAEKAAAAEAAKADASRKASSDAGEEANPTNFTFTKRKILIVIGVGLVAGLASGYVGVGGGFIMVPMFLSFLAVNMRHASGTSLVAVTILAIPGAIEQGLLGNIDYIAGIAMAAGSIPGAMIGASFIRRIPERQLRFMFGGFLCVAALALLVNEYLAL